MLRLERTLPTARFSFQICGKMGQSEQVNFVNETEGEGKAGAATGSRKKNHMFYTAYFRELVVQMTPKQAAGRLVLPSS